MNRLSACTSAWIRAGSQIRRESALTATGSVLASTAPRTNARATGSPATAPATAATAAAEASTSPTARITTGRQTACTSRQGSSSLAAYSSGGSTTRLTTEGGTCTCGTPGTRPASRPVTTSSGGAGTRSRPANAATTVASATSTTTVSTLCMQPGRPLRSETDADQTSRRAVGSHYGPARVASKASRASPGVS